MFNYCLKDWDQNKSLFPFNIEELSEKIKEGQCPCT